MELIKRMALGVVIVLLLGALFLFLPFLLFHKSNTKKHHYIPTFYDKKGKPHTKQIKVQKASQSQNPDEKASYIKAPIINKEAHPEYPIDTLDNQPSIDDIEKLDKVNVTSQAI